MAILRRTAAALAFSILALAMVLTSCSDPMEHAHCDDTEIKRAKSPNGKLVAVIYNRNCSRGSSLMTYGEVEDPSQWVIWPRARHPEVCFLVTVHDGYHQMDLTWRDDHHIEVTSNDELAKESVSYPESHCNDIEVTYNFRFAPPPLDEAPDQDTIQSISTVMGETEKCVDNGSHPERIARLRSAMEERRHGDALEWLCTYLKQEHCRVSSNSLALIQRAAAKMRRAKMSCYQLDAEVNR
jgi:hypothetical protein